MPKAPVDIILAAGQVKALPLSAIAPDPDQIRKTFDAASLKELAADIKLRGLEQPITVRANGKGWIIKHGERRWRAAKLAGLKTIDCILARATTGEDKEFRILVDQYAENIMREDLNPIDLAHFFRSCRDDYGMKATEIPAMLKQYGIKKDFSDSHIRNLIRLTELPDWCRTLIQRGTLTAKHGMQLLPVVHLPEIMESLRDWLDKVLGDDDPPTAHDLARAVYSAMATTYPRARQDYISEHTNLDSKSGTFYDPKKLSPEEREKLGIVAVAAYSGNEEFITNLQQHGAHNAAAREKIEKSRAKAKAKENKKATPADAEGTTEANTAPREQALREYLHAWLGRALDVAIAKQSIKFYDRLIYWLAFAMPVYIRNSDEDSAEFHFAGPAPEYEARAEASRYVAETGLLHLYDFLAADLDHEKLNAILLRRAVAACDLATRCVIAQYLKLDLDKLFRVDDDYLKLYTREGLLALIRAAGLPGREDQTKLKNSELRRVMLDADAEAIGCPAVIAELYQASAEALIGTMRETAKEWQQTSGAAKEPEQTA